MAVDPFALMVEAQEILCERFGTGKSREGKCVPGPQSTAYFCCERLMALGRAPHSPKSALIRFYARRCSALAPGNLLSSGNESH